MACHDSAEHFGVVEVLGGHRAHLLRQAGDPIAHYGRKRGWDSEHHPVTLRSPGMYVFGYGSLLNVDSLRATLPLVHPGDCVPATLAGHVRTFDVGFPNDGSQPDKSYVAEAGPSPHVVLFANLRPSPAGPPVNGILIPVTPAGFAALVDRERRYRPVDRTDAVGVDHAQGLRPHRVQVFLGRPRFTRGQPVAGAVIARDYLAGIRTGVTYWDARRPGFRDGFEASTRLPEAERVAALRRVDATG